MAWALASVLGSVINRQVASGGEELLVTLMYHPQGIAGSDGLPGDKGDLVSMAEPLTVNREPPGQFGW